MQWRWRCISNDNRKIMLSGICVLPVIPMRITQSDKSEMINQILFGETFKILKKNDNWSYIRLDHDSYEGWIDNKQYQNIKSKNTHYYIANKNANILINKIKQPLILGSLLTNNLKLREEIKLVTNLVFLEMKQFKIWFIKIAKTYLNTPYLWGGRTTLGIDCSGYTQIVYRFFQINLPRDSYLQAKVGKRIQNTNEIKLGDLAFFKKNNKVHHVGIILSKNKIIHASGKVRIDTLDKIGIFNKETNNYSHTLSHIQRVFN